MNKNDINLGLGVCVDGRSLVARNGTVLRALISLCLSVFALQEL